MVDRLERFISSSSSIYGEGFNGSPREFKLNRGEQSVFGYFPSSTKAQKALQEIKNLGFEIAQMDRVGMYGNTTNPLDGGALSQAGLSLGSSSALPDSTASERVLLAAQPSVSGMAARDYGVAGGETFLLTVVADGVRTPEVMRIIKENGGSV